MKDSFRTAVFSLCKKLYNNSDAIQIRELIHSISVVVSKGEDDDVLRKPRHGDLAMIGADQKLQFLGYILADDAVEEINKTPPFAVTKLEDDERELIECANNTLLLFVNACISELNSKYQKMSLLLDPYSLCKKPKLRFNHRTIIAESDLVECVEAFKNGKLYKKMISNDTLRLYEKVDTSFIYQLVLSQQKQFAKDFVSISQDTRDFYLNANNTTLFHSPDVLMIYTIYSYALRKSLTIACQMLFEAILGFDMIVLNNDNIIKMTDRQSDFIYDRYSVLTQEMMIGFGRRGIGSLALLNCTTDESSQIKEFCEIYGTTLTFNKELGNSSKIKMVSVDEELNPIHRYTDYLINTKLGRSTLKPID